MSYLQRLATEPPFRLVSLWFIRTFSKNAKTRARWSADLYTPYLTGIVEGARLAAGDGLPAITVVEFGVASGRGLLAMQSHARRVEDEMGIEIHVVGFDAGGGLPDLIGDHRDHPDYWRGGDFPMDLDRLKRQIDPKRTRLIIGNVRETVPKFVAEGAYPPIGFISFDLDLYSSTTDALAILRDDRRSILRRTPLYFDDVNNTVSNPWAGERLAIEEFNKDCADIKISAWYGLKYDKPFPEWHYWDQMMIAHDLKAIDRFVLDRSTRAL